MTAASLDHERYDALVAFAAQMLDETRPSQELARDDAETLALLDARLLDGRRYEEWLSLFTPDGLYWVPSGSPIEDPRAAVSYTLDDLRRLRDRIALLDTGWAHSQIPPSRTIRVVGGVEAWQDDSDALRASTSVVVWDWRRGELTPHPARLYYQLRATTAGWRIALRIFHRADAGGPIRNVSFVL